MNFTQANISLRDDRFLNISDYVNNILMNQDLIVKLSYSRST